MPRVRVARPAAPGPRTAGSPADRPRPRPLASGSWGSCRWTLQSGERERPLRRRCPSRHLRVSTRGHHLPATRLQGRPDRLSRRNRTRGVPVDAQRVHLDRDSGPVDRVDVATGEVQGLRDHRAGVREDGARLAAWRRVAQCSGSRGRRNPRRCTTRP